MYNKEKLRGAIFGAGLRIALVVIAVVVVCLVSSTQAQTYRVLYTFDVGRPNPWGPNAGLFMDTAGNLYGTTIRGGGQGDCPPPGGCGAVFQLTPTGSGWVETLLHGFSGPYNATVGLGPGGFGGTDGAYPYAKPIIGPDGNLYGTTNSGASGWGTVYQLKPSAGGWTENVLHRFAYGDYGSPYYGDLVFDAAGSLYGTTITSVFQLTHSGSSWTKSILHSFLGGTDGTWLYSGVIFDNLGNLYGTTSAGGSDDCRYGGPNCGMVFQLTPSASGWTEKIIYNFHDGTDGGSPSGLIFDRSGNLLGTICGGSSGGGAVFMLSPSGDSWTFHVLYRLPGTSCRFLGTLALDATGDIYGATFEGGAYGRGLIYKLAPDGGGWTYTDLYDFTGGSDGGEPNGSLMLDQNGNLYGTTQYGGVSHYCGGAPQTGCGVVFEITP